MMNKLLYKYLFLDRDGVINVERKGDYVKNLSEFTFEKNALEAISKLSKSFDNIFVVTNQRGVGRGVMSIADLEKINGYMTDEAEKIGGSIKNVYYCTDLSPNSINRKPNVGMAFQVLKDYPQVNLTESVMVGNSLSDIQFGKKLGMYSVLVGDKYQPEDEAYQIADNYFSNLYEFALSFTIT